MTVLYSYMIGMIHITTRNISPVGYIIPKDWVVCVLLYPAREGEGSYVVRVID